MTVRLLDLPGVAEIEAAFDRKYEDPNGEWSKEYDGLPAEVDRVSLALFGVTEADCAFETPTFVYPDPPATPSLGRPVTDDEWERHEAATDAFWIKQDALRQAFNAQVEKDREIYVERFHVLHLSFEEQAPFWAAVGWDVSNAAGEESWAIYEFGMQIICALSGLKGTLPNPDTILTDIAEREASRAIETSAEEWGADLAKEAARFRAPKTGRR